MNAWARASFGLLLCVVLRPGYCLERISAELGMGNYVDVVGVGVGTSDWGRWSVGKDWSLSVYGAGMIAYWRGDSDHSDHEGLVDLSAAPVLRLERSGTWAFEPYLEASIGLHLLSHTRINEKRQFSTAFQFGEFLGFGVTFGEAHRYDLSLRVQHVSNGGIRNPNDGLTYGALVFQYRFGQVPVLQ
jgi:hypothetical protein